MTVSGKRERHHGYPGFIHILMPVSFSIDAPHLKSILNIFFLIMDILSNTLEFISFRGIINPP